MLSNSISTYIFTYIYFYFFLPAVTAIIVVIVSIFVAGEVRVLSILLGLVVHVVDPGNTAQAVTVAWF